MKEQIPSEILFGILNDFYCTKDKDIQEFLQNKALDYENRNWASTYVLVDENKIKTDGIVQISGYFTLTNKILGLSEKLSTTLRKKIAGGLKKTDNNMHFILIGQLGKYINETEEKCIYGNTTAYELLDKAFEIIYQVKERIVCRNVLIECKNEIKIRNLYENYGFRELQQDENMVQYFKII